MDSRVVDDSHVHEQQQVGKGEDEHNNGKKSVLRRMKAKAIKIKDTIKKHGHGHNIDHEYSQEDQHIPDDHDLDEEDDQDEVEGIVQDPEVHGAPVYESAAIRSAIAGQEPNQEPENVVVSSSADQTEAAKSLVGEEKIGERKVNLEEEPHATPDSRAEAYTPPNYQSKVPDPTGAGTEEIYVTSIQNSFTGMNIQDEPSRDTNTEPEVLPTADGTESSSAEGNEQKGLPTADETKCHSTGSHDQFSPQQSAITETQYLYAGSRDQSSPKPVHENPEETLETNDATNTIPEEQSNYKPVKDPSDHVSHTEKISSTTSASDENQMRHEKDKSENAISMPRTSEDPTNTLVLSGNTTSMIGSAADGKKIASSVTEKLASVYGAGSVVISNSPDSGIPKQEKGVSMKDYLAEKLRPGEEDKALSEVISEVFHNKKEKPTTTSGDEDRDMAEVASDAVHEPKEELKKTENGIEESNVNSPGKGGVVDKLKGMVGSWFGKAAENQTSQGGEGSFDHSAPEVDAGQSSQAAGREKTS